jgi:hypothetical protein
VAVGVCSPACARAAIASAWEVVVSLQEIEGGEVEGEADVWGLHVNDSKSVLVHT